MLCYISCSGWPSLTRDAHNWILFNICLLLFGFKISTASKMFQVSLKKLFHVLKNYLCIKFMRSFLNSNFLLCWINPKCERILVVGIVRCLFCVVSLTCCSNLTKVRDAPLFAALFLAVFLFLFLFVCLSLVGNQLPAFHLLNELISVLYILFCKWAWLHGNPKTQSYKNVLTNMKKY